MDVAIHYIELILSSPRAVTYLRSGALSLAFWERQLVDVILCFIGITLLPVVIFATLIHIILRKTHRRKSVVIRENAMNKKNK